MNKIVYALLFFPFLFWSQTNDNVNNKVVRYYYYDNLVSKEIWYGTDNLKDSIKTYYPNGNKNEIIYYDNKGLKNSNAFQFDKQGEKLVTWNFAHGRLLSRIDHKLPYNKDKEEDMIKTLQILKKLNEKTNYNPTTFKDIYQRGRLRLRLGNKTLALEDFRKVEFFVDQTDKKSTKIVADSILKKRDQFKSQLYDNIAGIYASFEMENYSFQYSYKAMAMAPNDYRIMYNFSTLLQRKKSYDLARYYLEKIITEKPEHAHARWGIAILYTDLGEYEKAMESIQIAFKYEKKIIERSLGYGGRDLKTTRGFLYHKLGESEKGIKDLKEALEMDPNNSYAMKNLGIIYLDQKKYDEACTLFQKAKELKYTLTYDKDDLEPLLENACNHVQPEITIEKPKSFVSPNPATTVITIENYDFKNFDYEFFDYESNSVLRGNSSDNIIGVSRLKPGFYILKIYNADSPQTFKVIKQ